MDTAVLLIIDVQKGLDEPALGKRNNPGAETNIALLLSAWRERDWPVVHVQHCSLEPDSPLRPGLPGHAFKDQVKPVSGEKIIRKSANSAFVGTDLAQWLIARELSSLVIVGLTTEHCVSASTRSASDLGFVVTLIGDATASFEHIGYDGNVYCADVIHSVNLVSLDREFCTVRSTQQVLVSLA